MENKKQKVRAGRNRTINLSDVDLSVLKQRLIKIDRPVSLEKIENKTKHQDIFEELQY